MSLTRRQMLAALAAAALAAPACGQVAATRTPETPMTDPMHDLLVIGGGPAGLSAALIAGRASLNTALIDAGQPRNAVTRHSHGLFTRDGATPAELREIGRSQLAKYPTVQLVDDRVDRLTRDESGVFTASLASGERVRAPRVIVATGWRDHLERTGVPDIQLAYGSSVYPCPFCDGFEQRDRKLGIFVGTGAAFMLGHYAAMVSVLSTPHFTVFANGQTVPDETRTELEARGNLLVDAEIEGLDVTDGQLEAVRTADGTRHPCEAGFVMGDYAEPSTPFLLDLGIPHSENMVGWSLPETQDGATDVPGLWVAGDARLGFGGLANASAHGYSCGAMVVREVAMNRWHP